MTTLIVPIVNDDEALRFAAILAPYREPPPARAAMELVATALPFLGLSAAAMIGVNSIGWVFLLLSFPAGGFLSRLFMIQHDCGHGSFFKERWANTVLGRLIGILTFTPYAYWRHMHARHHATAGSLG
jgi:omega-6 fatty acid desaturase (delta-12 desaturase)